MKQNTHLDVEFLSNCDSNYIIWGALNTAIFITIKKYCILFIGTVLGMLGINVMTRSETKDTPFKTGGSGFEHNTDLKQTIKHGFILYIVIALLAVPAGICATQHLTFEYEPPLITRGPAPAELHQEFESITFTMTAEELKRAIAQADAEAALAALPPFHQPIMKAAQEYEVDAALIRAIIMAESSYNPKAVSHRGAQGLMQLMPTTARWLGVEDAFNPELNIDGGVRYLKRLLNRFDGNVKLALAAYNAGSRYVRKYGGVPPFRATRVYIKKVLKYRQKYENETASKESSLTAV